MDCHLERYAATGKHSRETLRFHVLERSAEPIPAQPHND